MDQPRKDVSEEPVLERIMDLLREQKKTDKELTDYLGMTNGVFSKWKYQGGKSYFKHIKEIAEFLEVTPAYLLHGDDDIQPNALSGQETRLLSMYRKLDTGGRETIMDVMDRFVQAVKD